MKTTAEYIIDKEGNLVVPMTTTDAVIDVSTKITLKTDLANIKQQITNVVKSPMLLNNDEIILGSTGTRNVKSSGVILTTETPSHTSGNGTVPTSRAVYLGINELEGKTFLQFSYDTSTHTFSLADRDIVTALILKKPVLFQDDNGYYYMCTYIDTTLQKIRFMGVNQNEDNFIELEFSYTEPSRALTWISTTNRIYARTDGQYVNMGAGIIVPKESDAVIDGDNESVSYLFRSTAGNQSVSDGSAYIMSLKGNLREGVATNPTHIKAVGFNAFNTDNVISNAMFDANGNIVADTSNGNCIAFVKVLGGISAVGENNGYGINRNGRTESSDVSVLEVRWCPFDSTPAIGLKETTLLELTSNYNSESYISPDDGYMLIQTKTTDGLCVHLCWSGYRDRDYEPYSESVVAMNQNYPHVWGLGKAGDVQDIIDYKNGEVHVNVERIDLSNCSWEESYSSTNGYSYASSDISTLVEPGTQNISCYEMIDASSYSITVSVGGIVTLYSGNRKLTPATDIYGYLYYEANQSVTADIPTTPVEYYISDFGTEEFLGTKTAPMNVVTHYSPDLVDGLRYLIAKALTVIDSHLSLESENPVMNKVITEELSKKANQNGIIYVYELGLDKINIKSTISGTLTDLTYVSGQDVSVDTSKYGKFEDASSNAYYIMLTGAVLHKTTLDVYTYDGMSMTSVGSYTKDNVTPKNTTPTFGEVETYQNTQFHLFDGNTDRYYYWEPSTEIYVNILAHIKANSFYIWKTAFTEGQVLYVTFDNVEDETMYNDFMLQFETGATLPTLSFPNTIRWNIAPDLDVNVTYQISVLNDIGLIVGGLE